MARRLGAPICILDGCDRPARKFDFCFRHHREASSEISARAARTAVGRGGRPTVDQVREILNYDPETGAFTWLVKLRRIRPGTPAGTDGAKGYVRISIGNRPYMAHRLAIFWMTGEWPPQLTDHRNGDKGDNRWENIRPATPTVNAQNIRQATKRSKLGVLGVSPPAPGRAGYKAMIQVDGKSIHLGMYSTPEAAHAAYVAAKRIFHEGATI